jgi:hypothetical protein
MIKLKALEQTWIGGKTDDPQDQCSHGYVNFSVGDTMFLSHDDGEFTTSGAALFLLRTLSSDHTADTSIAESNLLFPCCAFNPWLMGENNSLVVMGCNGGIDVSIRHLPDNLVAIEAGDKHVTVTEADWVKAVLSFVSQVEQFYSSSSPKAPIEDDYDRSGWEAFWLEWRHTASRYRSAA